MPTKNITSKYKFQIKRSARKKDRLTNQPLIVGRPAFLGDNSGNITTYQGAELPDGYVVVRDMDGNLSVAYNDRVPNVANTFIQVGYDPLKPTLFQVLDTSDYYTSQLYPAIATHHKTHEWPNPDTIWIRGEQFIPQLVVPAGGFLIEVYPGFVQSGNVWVLVENQTIDMTANIPTSGARMVLVAVDSAGVIHKTNGAVKGSPFALLPSDIPATPGGQAALCAVRLFVGQTTIRKTETYTDIFDLRFGGGTGGGAIWGQITGSLINQTDLWDALISIRGGHAHGTTRWTSDGSTVYELPDVAMSLIGVYDNSLRVDPVYIGLSDDGTQVIFETAPTVGHVIVADYILEMT